MNTVRGFQISDLSSPQKVALADRVHILSDLSWAHLRRKGRHHGSEPISPQQIRRQIPSCVEAQDAILSIRVQTNEVFRMIGYRRNRTLHVLLLDPEGVLYDHGG